jgi:hypothetical protein
MICVSVHACVRVRVFLWVCVRALMHGPVGPIVACWADCPGRRLVDGVASDGYRGARVALGRPIHSSGPPERRVRICGARSQVRTHCAHACASTRTHSCRRTHKYTRSDTHEHTHKHTRWRTRTQTDTVAPALKYAQALRSRALAYKRARARTHTHTRWHAQVQGRDRRQRRTRFRHP